MDGNHTSQKAMSVKQDNKHQQPLCKWKLEWIKWTLRVHSPQSLVQQISLDRPWFLADTAQWSCACLWHHLAHPIACPQPENSQNQLLRETLCNSHNLLRECNARVIDHPGMVEPCLMRLPCYYSHFYSSYPPKKCLVSHFIILRSLSTSPAMTTIL